MSYMMLSGLLYLCCLILPLGTIWVLVKHRANLWLFGSAALATVFIALPAYIALLILLPGWTWPPDIISQRVDSIQAQAQEYNVRYTQSWGGDFYTTYFEVIDQDGRTARTIVDGDDNKCWSMTTQQQDGRIYFLCDDQSISDQTSYVDTENLVLYNGWMQQSTAIPELNFD